MRRTFLYRQAAFLEDHRAEISQRRVNPPVIVKLKPVGHLVLCLTACQKVRFVQLFDLQRTEERFGHGVDTLTVPPVFRLIEPCMPKVTSCFWKSPLAYWLKDQAVRGASTEPGHAQCVDNQGSSSSIRFAR